MKKYIVLFSFFAALAITGCSPYTDEEPGGVVTQELCGTWVITAEVSLDEYLGNVDLSDLDNAALDAVNDWEDYYGEKVFLRTYNTAANESDSLWFDDGYTTGQKFKIGCKLSDLTFAANEVEDVEGNGTWANIRYGKVLKGAATTPRGQQADSIIAYVYLDSKGLTFKYSGFRYTGFAQDTY